jgi:hypothetical protein
MPFVRIFLRPGTTPEYRKALGDGVHRALMEAIAIPPDDRFQVISEHAAADLIYDAQYLGVHRSDRIVFVQITMSQGRRNRRESSSSVWRKSLRSLPGWQDKTGWSACSKRPRKIGRLATAKHNIWIREGCRSCRSSHN